MPWMVSPASRVSTGSPLAARARTPSIRVATLASADVVVGGVVELRVLEVVPVEDVAVQVGGAEHGHPHAAPAARARRSPAKAARRAGDVADGGERRRHRPGPPGATAPRPVGVAASAQGRQGRAGHQGPGSGRRGWQPMCRNSSNPTGPPPPVVPEFVRPRLHGHRAGPAGPAGRAGPGGPGRSPPLLREGADHGEVAVGGDPEVLLDGRVGQRRLVVVLAEQQVHRPAADLGHLVGRAGVLDRSATAAAVGPSLSSET